MINFTRSFLLLGLLITWGCQVQNEDPKNHEVSSGHIIDGAFINENDEARRFSVSFSSIPRQPFVGCSGIVISKRVILTSAHCLFNKSLEQTKVFTAPLQENGQTPFILPVAFHIHPDYDSVNHSRADLGLIVLETNLPDLFIPIPLFSSTVEDLTLPLEIYGYSTRKDNVTRGNPFEFFTPMTPNTFDAHENYAQKNVNHLRGKLVAGDYQKEDSTILYQFDGGICNSDSGGPAVFRFKGKRVLYGINWAAEENCSSWGFIHHVAPYIDWIKETIASYDQTISTVTQDKITLKDLQQDDLSCVLQVKEVIDRLIPKVDFGNDNDENDYREQAKGLCLVDKDFVEFTRKKIKDAKKHCRTNLSKDYPSFLTKVMDNFQRRCGQDLR